MVKRKQKKKKQKSCLKRLFWWILLLILLAGGAYWGYQHRRGLMKRIGVEREMPRASGSDDFRDLQPTQIKAAEKNGISKPLKDNKGIDKLVKKGKLQKISSCKAYDIDPLTHSYPYLVPKAAQLLKEIGEGVQQRTGSESRIIVTSVLRTEESVSRLQKGNINATSRSCHLFGTTIDITYVRYHQKGHVTDQQMAEALKETLRQLRKQKRCYVMCESKQHCYHITVR